MSSCGFAQKITGDMSSTAYFSSSLFTFSQTCHIHIHSQSQNQKHYCYSHYYPVTSNPKLKIRFHSLKSTPSPLFLAQASRKLNNYSLDNDHRNWSRSINSDFVNGVINDDDDDGDEDEEEEEDDRSLDLLVRFVQNVFKKISKRARKAVRSVLPVSISSKLVGFSVNGVLVLAFFWVLKALIEVVCTVGSVVFVSILLIRGIWSGITYLQESRRLRLNELDGDPHAWTGAQPAT